MEGRGVMGVAGGYLDSEGDGLELGAHLVEFLDVSGGEMLVSKRVSKLCPRWCGMCRSASLPPCPN